MSIEDAVALVIEEDRRIADAVHAARGAIASAVELVAERLARGGRLFYVGAGTSGRLGLLDAVECPPTFQTQPETVQAVLAGGDSAFLRAVEGAEDEREGAWDSLRARDLGESDVVFGIAAGGTTPYVHGALEFARSAGAGTVFLACVPKDQAPDDADVSIRVVTGPEVVAGSTRLKAGTATKMVLNAVSTLTMVRLGKVHDNLMVDVNTRSNSKLVDRGIRLIQTLADTDRETAEALLERSGGRVKIGVLMHVHGESAAEAEARLTAADFILRRALES